MNTSTQTIDISLFKDFIPLNTLDRNTLKKLVAQVTIQRFPAGNFLFERGDTVHQTLFLLEGEIELCSPIYPTQKISANSDAGHYPIAHSFPRQFTALSVTDVRVLILPLDILEIIPADKNKGNAGTGGAHADAWKTQWLNSPMLRNLPAANKEALLARMEEIKVQAGQVIIHQDEPADSYFVIKQGRCGVLRRPAHGARDVKLAELNEGQGFGEEALITNVARNATITMLTDGSVLRLSKQDFISFLARPLLHHLPFQNAIELVEQGAVLIDVRAPEEFEIDGLIGSLNMPLPVLRLKANRLHRDSTYIVYSNTGHFSSVAAFLLIQQGLKAYVLQGGLSTAPKHRMKRGAFNDHDPEGHTTAGSTNKVLSFPHGANGQHNESSDAPHKSPSPKPSQPVDWNLISDDVLWRSTIGYRSDSGIEAAMAPTPSASVQPPIDTTLQGFDDIRLFTTIDTAQEIKVSNADVAQPVVAFPQQSQKAPQSRPAEPGAVTRRHQITQPWQGGSSHHYSSRRWRFATVAIVACIGAVFGYSYFTTGAISTKLDQASPLLLEQQRKLDAKVTRLMNAIQTLSAQSHAKEADNPATDNSSVTPPEDTKHPERSTSSAQGQIIRDQQKRPSPATKQ